MSEHETYSNSLYCVRVSRLSEKNCIGRFAKMVFNSKQLCAVPKENGRIYQVIALKMEYLLVYNFMKNNLLKTISYFRIGRLRWFSARDI